MSKAPASPSILQREPGGLAAPRVQSLLAQLLSAIGGVHRAGLMHRDIKPANIILRDDDRVVLIDFGSSRATTSGLTTDYTKIYSGGYAPPEQMLGMRQGAFSDIYAIGAVCYRAIGGTVVDGQARQIALTVGRPDPQPSASQIGAGRYPGPLLATIDAALTIDATKRPQSIDAMLAALGQDEPAVDATVMAAHRPVPATAPQLHPQPSMRRRGVLGVIAGLGALVVIATTYIELRSPATPPAGQPDVVTSMQASGSSPPVVTPQRQEHGTGVVDGRRRGATGNRGRWDVGYRAPAPAHRGTSGGSAATRGDHGASTRAAAFANDAFANYTFVNDAGTNDAFANDAGTNDAGGCTPSSTRPGVAGGAAATPGDGSAGTTTRAATRSVSTSVRARPCITITGRAAATPGDGGSPTGTLTDVSAVAARIRAGGGSLPTLLNSAYSEGAGRAASLWPRAGWTGTQSAADRVARLGSRCRQRHAGRSFCLRTHSGGGLACPTDLGCRAPAVGHSARSARGGERPEARD